MSKYACHSTTPPINPEVHRQIRLRRLGLQGAVARAVADLAFGQPRDAVLVVAISDTGTPAEAVRQ